MDSQARIRREATLVPPVPGQFGLKGDWPSMPHEGKVEQYFQLVDSRHLYSSSDRLKCHLGYLFQSVPLVDAKVLDIGCGSGLLSIYAACVGAKDVVGLEPGDVGFTSGSHKQFERLVGELKLSNVVLIPERLQEWSPSTHQFDVVVMSQTINHLDEGATISLRSSASSRDIYRSIFRQIMSLTRPGGRVIITDVAPCNLFSFLHITNPFARTIEWHKHQHPAEWSRLLTDVGFRSVAWSWLPPNRVGRLATLMANRVGAFLTTGAFCLTAIAPPDTG